MKLIIVSVILYNIICGTRAQLAVQRVAVGGNRVAVGGSRVLAAGPVVGAGPVLVGGGARVVGGGPVLVGGGAPIVSGGAVYGGVVGAARPAVSVLPVGVANAGVLGLGLSSGIAGIGGIGLGGVAVGSQAVGPVSAAIITRRTVDFVNVPVPQDVITPQTLIVEPNQLPVNIEFRSQSSPVNVNQVHIPGPPGQVQFTQSEEEPDRLVHEVVKPVIQEVRETITPYRTLTQEILPVQEVVNTLVARGERQQVLAAPAVATVAAAPVVTAAAAPVIAAPVASFQPILRSGAFAARPVAVNAGVVAARPVAVNAGVVAQPIAVGGQRLVSGGLLGLNGGAIGGGLIASNQIVGGARVVGQPIVANIRRA